MSSNEIAVFLWLFAARGATDPFKVLLKIALCVDQYRSNVHKCSRKLAAMKCAVGFHNTKQTDTLPAKTVILSSMTGSAAVFLNLTSVIKGSFINKE